METNRRRRVLQTMAALPFASASGGGAGGAAEAPNEMVRFTGDGLSLTPAESTKVLGEIVAARGIDGDYYSRGGVVEELEETFAAALGKERAVFLPTGTLANHLAIRKLCGARTRAIVPAESHLYNDSGDCAQQLSQLNLVPLASEGATFTLEDVRRVVERTDSGRVETGVGALLIESPVRRLLGELFDYDAMKSICAYAKEQGIGTHLDGARLYMASAYSGISPREYASHFDTVYVSLWKYFNAASGAILAGPAEHLDGFYHLRRMFGGGLPGAWPFAAVALRYFDGFEAELASAVARAKELFERLDHHDAFTVEAIPNGSNLFKLKIAGSDLDSFRERLASEDIRVSAPREAVGGFVLNVNPTLNRRDASSLYDAFVRSL